MHFVDKFIKIKPNLNLNIGIWSYNKIFFRYEKTIITAVGCNGNDHSI